MKKKRLRFEIDSVICRTIKKNTNHLNQLKKFNSEFKYDLKMIDNFCRNSSQTFKSRII